jgi:hypothetical protein
MPSTTPEEYYREVKDDANDYQETVLTLLAFSALVCHDGRNRRAGSHFGFGRRMQTSGANVVSANNEVTPDCVAQMSADYGIAAEVKKQISNDQERWQPHVQQLRKYDDQLLGWWTDDEAIPTSDAVMLIHQSRGRLFTRFLEEAARTDPDAFGPNSAVVEFNRADEGQPYIFLRLEKGSLRDPDLHTKLDAGVPIPMEKVKLSFPSVGYYDSEPPLPEMMKNLWIDSFASQYDPSLLDPATGLADITISVRSLTEELQRAYGSGALEIDDRSVVFPRTAWVTSAMNAFVDLELAVRRDTDTYGVKYKPLPSNVDALEYFARKVFALRSQAADNPAQLDLLPPP